MMLICMKTNKRKSNIKKEKKTKILNYVLFSTLSTVIWVVSIVTLMC